MSWMSKRLSCDVFVQVDFIAKSLIAGFTFEGKGEEARCFMFRHHGQGRPTASSFLCGVTISSLGLFKGMRGGLFPGLRGFYFAILKQHSGLKTEKGLHGKFAIICSKADWLAESRNHQSWDKTGMGVHFNPLLLLLLLQASKHIFQLCLKWADSPFTASSSSQ